ncbi:hypothetical protein FLLO111716_09860 [Flavobacterium longum]
MMKNALASLFFLCTLVGFSQNPGVRYEAEKLFPELFQMKLPIAIPPIQFVPEKEIYMKENRLKVEQGKGYRIVFKNKSVYLGSVLSNYGAHEKTVSISYGKIDFPNGDSYQGHFFEGHPVQGNYTYANGDSAEIISADREGCCNYKGKSTNIYYTFKNGAKLTVKPPQVEYQAPDGAKVISSLTADNHLNGYTEYTTKEGYSYKGELANKKPVKKWEVENADGSFLAVFNLDGITGFIPYKNESGRVDWGEFYLGKLIRPLRYLAPYTFCDQGDCQNGDAIIDVKKDPETGSNFKMYGVFSNGKPSGDFTADKVDENGYKYTIVGPIENYRFHGKCTKAYLDYKIAFTGTFANGLPQSGNLTVNDKLIAVKSFKNGKYLGKQIFPRRNEYSNNSRFYEGEFSKYGQIEGAGTVFFETGYRLTASNWKDGQSSACTFTRPDNYTEDDFYCDIATGSYFRSLGNAKEQAYYASLRDQEEQQKQQDAAKAAQSETQCGQCNGLGVIKITCPMCKGAGYRKDMVTYDRHTGNTGGLAKCSHCAGTGQYTVMGCSKCDGKGFVKK